MHIKSCAIPEVFIIAPTAREDLRGDFIKLFSRSEFNQLPMCTSIAEEFISHSKQNVIRGMHFQIPPHACAKYVCALQGTMLDVVLDLRTDSPKFGQHEVFILNAIERNILYIPRGCAHGFLALTENVCTHYLQSEAFDAHADAGIRFDTFGMNWPVQNPILSERDRELQAFEKFKSPFTPGGL